MSKTKKNFFITSNFGETQKLAENFIKRLEGKDVVALYGNLGNGKTTFVQGLARGLGVKKRIISPTFIIVRQHKVSPPRSPSPLRASFAEVATKAEQGFAGRVGRLGGGEDIRPSTPARCNTFYHVDLYRIENQREIEELGLKEILEDQNSVVVIEWAEKMKNLLPKKRWDVKFEDLGGSRRKITINQKL